MSEPVIERMKWPSLLNHCRLMIWRPMRAIIRLTCFRDEVKAWAERNSARVAATFPVDGSREFMAQLRSTFPRVEEFIEQLHSFFDRTRGPNNVCFLCPDLSSSRMLRISIEASDGVTESELRGRMRAALEAIADFDQSDAQISQLSASQIAKMALATCRYEDEPNIGEISKHRINLIHSQSPRLWRFVEFYQTWLRSGKRL